jgi:hypothetical protein
MVQVRAVAPGEAIEDGSMYSILWDDATEEIPYKTRVGIPIDQRITIIKYLRFICREWWCQCKDSIARLDGIAPGEFGPWVKADCRFSIWHAQQYMRAARRRNLIVR